MGDPVTVYVRSAWADEACPPYPASVTSVNSMLFHLLRLLHECFDLSKLFSIL